MRSYRNLSRGRYVRSNPEDDNWEGYGKHWPDWRSQSVLANAIYRLGEINPYYSGFISGVPRTIKPTVRIEDQDIPIETACVAWIDKIENHTFNFNPDFLAWLYEQRPAGEVEGVTLHEIFHIVHEHCIQRPAEDPHGLWNIASDLLVNAYVLEPQKGEKLGIPDFAVTADKYPDLFGDTTWDPKEYSTMEIFDQLVKAHEENEKEKKEQKQGPKKPGSGQGQKPGQKQKPGQQKTGTPGPISREQVGRNAAKAGKPYTGSGGHELWDKVKPENKEKLRQRILERAREGLKNSTKQQQDALPPFFKDLNAEATAPPAPPAVNWRSVLRNFVDRASRTFIKSRMSRPSKRYGTFPGTRIKSATKVLVAIDTSASMPNETIDAVTNELNGIINASPNIEIMVALFTDRIYFLEKKHKKGRSYNDVRKSGGTSFASVLQYIKDQHLDRDVSAIIFLTDGGDWTLAQADADQFKPACPVLWIVTSQWGMGDHLKWGRSILIEEKLRSAGRTQANPRLFYAQGLKSSRLR